MRDWIADAVHAHAMCADEYVIDTRRFVPAAEGPFANGGEGNQAVDTLFFNAHDYSDRYSAQDTIREQRNIYLTTGSKLMSTHGTVLLTIVADTSASVITAGTK